MQQPPISPAGASPPKLPPYRAMQLVHHLKLNYASDAKRVDPHAISVEESTISWRTILGSVISEMPSIAIAITASAAKTFKTRWLTGYLLVPLCLKLVALLVSVHRDSIKEDKEKTEGRPESKDELYRLDDPTHGYSIIQGPPTVVLQFFRHYGHPQRDGGVAGRRDRAREIFSMGLVYCFVLNFPAGLISSLWMPNHTQLLWLSFQVYCIFMMHLVRIVGWDNCGRTEARVARYLEQNKPVWLRRPDGQGVVATLETIDVASMQIADEQIQSIVDSHFRNRQAPP